MTLQKLSAILFCFFMSGCSLLVDKNTHDYPQASKDAFMASCMNTSGGKHEACTCMLTKVQEHYTYGEMANVEEKLKKGQKDPEFSDFMTKLNDTCVAAGSTPTASNSARR